jgi:hypothetical protein
VQYVEDAVDHVADRNMRVAGTKPGDPACAVESDETLAS